MSEYETLHGRPRSRWSRLTRRHTCYSYRSCFNEANPWIAAPAVIIGIFALIFALIMGGFAIDRRFSEKGCVGYGEQTDRDVRWVDASFFDYGCYVNWNDTWIPRDDYMRITFGHETGAES